MFYPISVLGKLFKWYLLMPSHPAKVRLQNILGKYLFPNGINIKNSKGLRFILSPNDWITRHILKTGNYEALSIDLANHILKTGGVFIDIGSNFGLYSCSVSYNNVDVLAIAVDPNYKIIGNLVSHLKLNKLKEIKIINAAVSSQFQMVSLEEPNPFNLGKTVSNIAGNGTFCVLSCSLEYILLTNNIHVVDLIKIDVEGNEFNIIESFPFDKFLIKNIIMEFRADSKLSLEILKSFFLSKGFEILNVTGIEIISETDILEDNIWLRNIKTLV